MSIFVASPFKISMFRQCPQKYKFQYIDKLAAEFRTPRPYLTMGQHVHSALRDFFQIQPAEARTLSHLQNLLRKHWRTNREGFESVEEEKKWGEKALHLLENFFHNQDVTITPYKVEETWEVPLNSDLILMGKIDRLDENSDGSLKIIDYKTGKQPADSDTFLKDDLQLIAYICIVTKKIHRLVSEGSCLYLETNERITLTPTSEVLEEGLSKIRQIINSIQMEQEFSPNPTRLCSFCDYLTICPARAQIEQSEFSKIAEEELPF